MNVVITGAGKGIGFALVQRFIKEPNCKVWACSRDVSALQALKASNLTIAALDVANCTEQDIFQAVAKVFDSVDILLQNAGVLINKPFHETPLEEWRRVFEVNLFSVVKINQALLPLLEKSAAGHIVHIGSMGGVQGSSKFPGLSAYSASKAALANLTECMAEELKPRNIHVNCLALGSVNKEMLRQAFPDYLANVSSHDMADFIFQFSVSQRSFFNGKIIPVSSSTP